ncbi:hypothetical protein L2E82_36936 [Cichorium intybus]|uniref:Uncharacterized protein n=1 Tax=Cichorium intybus TaxID=13427 RepID=A0ACB9ADM7_CICIN|nr:hypothetical protein L2E82_36936 [Cichorium intybus]
MSRKRTEDRSPPSPCPAVHRPPPAKRQCTGMSISSTKNEPAHYMLKVESFSILSENPTIKIESDVFEASRYRWRLDLYPIGNEEEEGKNHISLYLILCDTKDADGNRARFNEKQIIWGFDKLISLDHFKDNSKGYLFNDAFVFGAETSSNVEKSSVAAGNATGAGTDLSCFLNVHEARLFPNGWRIYAKFELRVKNQSGYDDGVKESDKWFCQSATSCGFERIMPLHELRDTTKGFILNNRLIVEAKILVVGIQKNCLKHMGRSRFTMEIDLMRPRIAEVDELFSKGVNVTVFNGSTVQRFNGQLDLLCATKGTEAWIKKLK